MLMLVPPLNFSMVLPNIYRSGYPNKRNFPFLRRLGLRTIVYLCPDDYSEDNMEFLNENEIQFHHFKIKGNKEPFEEISSSEIQEVIKIVVNPENHPILIHCNKGKHRVGCLVGVLRKLQNWSLTSIFDEYQRFSGPKARTADQEFIELFQQDQDENKS